MTDPSTTRDRLLSALEESDQRRRIGRVERIEWLSLHESQPGAMFGRTETIKILQEARETFVDGHFVASLLLATAFIEHTLAEELQLLQHAKGSLSFVEALKLASAHKVFPEDWIIRAEALRLKRNPFAHLKEASNKHTMGARYRELRMHPVAMANNSSTPVIAPSNAATSATVNTDGMRLGRVGRCTSSSQGNCTPKTSRYKTGH